MVRERALRSRSLPFELFRQPGFDLLVQIFGQAVELPDVFGGTQPGQLPFRQLSRGGNGFLAQCAEAEFPVQVLPYLPLTDTAH